MKKNNNKFKSRHDNDDALLENADSNKIYAIAVTNKLELLVIDITSKEQTEESSTFQLVHNSSVFDEKSYQYKNNAQKLKQSVLEQNHGFKIDQQGCFIGNIAYRVMINSLNTHLFKEKFQELTKVTFGGYKELKEVVQTINVPTKGPAPEIPKEYIYNYDHQHLMFLGSNLGAFCVIDWTVSILSVNLNRHWI